MQNVLLMLWLMQYLEALVEGDKSGFKGLGTFQVKKKKREQIINPRTRETIEINK